MANGENGMNGGSRFWPWAMGLAVFGLLAAGILSSGQAAHGQADLFLKRSRGEAVSRPLTPGQATYPLEVRRDGRIVRTTLQDFGAKLVFVNFWGTFCPPCIEELPSLLALARSQDARDMIVVAVSYDDDWQAIDDFFAKNTSAVVPPNFVVVRDPGAQAGRDLKAAFGTEKLPESYVVRGGTIEAKFVNGRDWIDPAIVGLIGVLKGG
jgi:cytochrome c biogenesis protein CcmG, thiol:disulfide interchange protein DsbE